MSAHVVSPRTYLAVFAALLVLTFVTTEASRYDLGQPDVFGFRIPLNVLVALGIACLKASLVVLFFMHVKYGERLVQLVIAAAFVWLFILILITISDYGSRPWPIAPTWERRRPRLGRARDQRTACGKGGVGGKAGGCAHA